ncbi:hypothetical protein ACFV27_31570 [Streptomyces antimycoticus]|uniref:aromatic-ring hydroxylase C-terminal domain-containing protein n=1 Tax=Streptomyces antimycoticus TaxID=68175 RepID=UPI003692E16E
MSRASRRPVGRVRGVADGHAAPTGVLVRPDGVVAWASDTTGLATVTGLEAALRRWTGAPTSSPEHEPVRLVGLVG